MIGWLLYDKKKSFVPFLSGFCGQVSGDESRLYLDSEVLVNRIPILITTYLAYHFKSRPVMGVTTGLVFLSLLGEFIYRVCIILKCNLHHYQLVADDSH